MEKIVVIEDDRDIAELIEYHVKQERFHVTVFHRGEEGLKYIKKQIPDLIILDLMLPDMGGLEICKLLKGNESTKHLPVMLVTAKGEEMDRVVGFEVGADDYLTKPFSSRELVLRVKAILRRREEGSKENKNEKIYVFGNIRLDPLKFQVMVEKAEVRMTSIEFKLLHYLLSTKGRVATREQLLDHVWGYAASVTTRTVDTHVKRLRKKLGSAGDYIETLRGTGYRFKESL